MATTDPSAVADTLDAAADLLWMYGRCHGAGTNAQGNLCIYGAVAVAKGHELKPGYCDIGWQFGQYEDPNAFESRRTPESRALVQEIGAFSPDEVWMFNDITPLTPEGDALVIDTVRRAAKTLRNSVSES
jgi:hypothetical protein